MACITNKRTLVVYNPQPHCLRQRRLRALCRALQSAHKQYLLLPTSADYQETFQLLRQHITQTNELIVVGGDGTLHQVINFLGSEQTLGSEQNLAIGYIPAGTGNDFARSWFGRNLTTAAYVQRALSGQIEKIDLGKINDRYFINSVGIGFDGQVIKNLAGKKSLWPRFTYVLYGFYQLFCYSTKKIDCQGDDSKLQAVGKQPSLLFVVANMRYFGAGLQVAPHAQANSQQLAWLQVKNGSLVKKLLVFVAIFRGKHLVHPLVTSGQLGVLTVKTTGLPIQADGEYLGETPARISCIPQAVSLRR